MLIGLKLINCYRKKKKYSFVVRRTFTEWREKNCLLLLLDLTVVLLSKQCQY